jgi:hypothetical protein
MEKPTNPASFKTTIFIEIVITIGRKIWDTQKYES